MVFSKNLIVGIGLATTLAMGVACEMEPVYKQAEEDRAKYEQATQIMERAEHYHDTAGLDSYDLTTEKMTEPDREFTFEPMTEETLDYKLLVDFEGNPYVLNGVEVEIPVSYGNEILQRFRVDLYRIQLYNQAADILSGLTETMPGIRNEDTRISSVRAFGGAKASIGNVHYQIAMYTWDIHFGEKIVALYNRMQMVVDQQDEAARLTSEDLSAAQNQIANELARARAELADAERTFQTLETEINQRRARANELNERRLKMQADAGKKDRESFDASNNEMMKIYDEGFEMNNQANRDYSIVRKERMQADAAEKRKAVEQIRINEAKKQIATIETQKTTLEESIRRKNDLIAQYQENAKNTTQGFISMFNEWNHVIDKQIKPRFDDAEEEYGIGIAMLESNKSVESVQQPQLVAKLATEKLALSNMYLTEANYLINYLALLRVARVQLESSLDPATRDQIDDRIKTLETRALVQTDKAKKSAESAGQFYKQAVALMNKADNQTFYNDQKDQLLEVWNELSADMEAQLTEIDQAADYLPEPDIN